MTHWVMDLEVMHNFFCAVFIDYRNSSNRRLYIIHHTRNDIRDLYEFLDQNIKNKEWHIGYNNLDFDSQIIHYMLLNKRRFLELQSNELTGILSNLADEITNKSVTPWARWSEKDLTINQLDVYKLNHWDNPAKRSSLKWIQYSMDWTNMVTMPIHHTTPIHTEQEINLIVDYCINDVLSTKAIFEKNKEQISLRKALTHEYKINLYNASEPRIAKEIFLDFLSKKSGMSKYNLRSLRTYRSIIRASDIILPYINFKTEPFNQMFEHIKKVVINPLQIKNSFKYTMSYKGIDTVFGLGGIHGARKSGIYSKSEDMIIVSADVSSFYPNLAIKNRWAPAHLPADKFCELYEYFYEERKKIPKKDPKNYVYKIILNSVYGLSNDQYSFLYDSELTMRITLNGQLSLAMLYEMICEGIPEAIPLIQNTDGIETMIPVSMYNRYLAICKDWERLTKLTLEHIQYQKIVLADVNNYIALSEYTEVKEKEDDINLYKEEFGKIYKAEVKCKGRFEFHDIALHKNKSFSVIPKALYHYFIKGIPPEEYLKTNKDIFDYCAGCKPKGDWKFFELVVKDGQIIETPINGVVRYYVSRTGCKLMKINQKDGRRINVIAGSWKLKTYTHAIKKEWEEFDVNPDYYKMKIMEEIQNITSIGKTKMIEYD